MIQLSLSASQADHSHTGKTCLYTYYFLFLFKNTLFFTRVLSKFIQFIPRFFQSDFVNSVGNKKDGDVSFPMMPPQSSTCLSALLGVSRVGETVRKNAEGPLCFKTSFCQKIRRQYGVMELTWASEVNKSGFKPRPLDVSAHGQMT